MHALSPSRPQPLAMPPHLLITCCRVLLLVAFIFFSLQPAGCSGKRTAGGGKSYYHNHSICHKSLLSCGGHEHVVDVRYPFFLANATLAIDGHEADSPYCGYAGMAITCDGGGGGAVMMLSGRSYTVLAIDYKKRAITLADRRDVTGGGDCPRVTHNVTLPAESETRFRLLSATANDTLSFFFDCAFTPGGGGGDGVPQPPPGIAPINCSSFPAGAPGTTCFMAPLSDVQQLQDRRWTRACRTVVLVPVLPDWRRQLNPDREHHLHLSSDGYGQVLKRGFQLSWERPSAGPCSVCEHTKGKCTYGRRGFIGCLCSDGSLRNQDCGLGRSVKKTIAYIISAVTGSIFLLFLLLSMRALYRKKFHGAVSWKRESEHIQTIEPFLKRYTYSEVKTMTNSFAHKLGKGGFGTVYMGYLPNGRDVAVKLLNSSNDDGQEFMNEVATITRTSHVNVVTLLGYCIQGTKRALVYEYMPNGSLERFSFGQDSDGKISLSWKKLFEIMVGIARGLEYLHRGCRNHIVHFDIKPHNILLDKDFCPKISDFGLAKLCMKKESIISVNGARGTIGYIAPEIFSKQFGGISSKSDVYSYGMMILEMVGARNNLNNCSETSSKYFPQWVYEHLEKYCDDAGEISTADCADNELVRKLITVGLWCIQLQPKNRPSMTRVIEMLESGLNDLQIPPQNLIC